MTIDRKDNHSTEFGLWLRKQREIDSQREGYIASNLDYIWMNYDSGKFMLIEEKRYNHRWIDGPQKKMFRVLDRNCKNDTDYRGFHLLTFQNTSPDDGWIDLDGIKITRDDLIRFLRFEMPDKWYETVLPKLA